MTPEFPDYQAARDYLTSRLDFERSPFARTYDSTHYNLERFARLMERLGSPERAYPSVHLAGTKGKGSTAAALESALRAAGLRTGLYTSPHLRDYPERIRLGSENASPEDFTRAMRWIASVLETGDAQDGAGEAVEPYRTVFELLTAMAFCLFREWKVEIAVLETGLGGRLDCTNLVLPEVAVITALGLEHTRQLGSTLEEIAAEKGGIIKPGRPVVVGPQPPVARRLALPVLRRLAAEREAPLTCAEWLFRAEIHEETEDGLLFSLFPAEPPGEPEARETVRRLAAEVDWSALARLRLPLAGRHQAENARAAAAAWAALRAAGWREALDWRAFRRGLETCRWPGRIEIVRSDPRAVIDGAHCPLSARALVSTLDALYPGAPRWFLAGFQRDKQIGEILRILAGAGAGEPPAPRAPIAGWAFYEVPGGRGADAEALAQAARELGVKPDQISTHASPAAAWLETRRRARPGEVIAACGTLYTVAELTALAREKVISDTA